MLLAHLTNYILIHYAYIYPKIPPYIHICVYLFLYIVNLIKISYIHTNLNFKHFDIFTDTKDNLEWGNMAYCFYLILFIETMIPVSFYEGLYLYRST